MEYCSLCIEYAKEIYDIEKSVFSDSYSFGSINDMCKNDLYRFSVVLKIDSNVVGYILATEVMGEAEILRIAVCSEQRRKGYANLLLQYFIDKLTKNNTKKIFLEVRQSNEAAISLYEKTGFTKCDVRKKYYSDNGEDAVIYVFETDKAVIDC